MSTQEQELAALLGDHSFHTGGYAAEQWFSCGCGWRSKAIHRFTAHTQHLRHIAEVIVAAGYERRRDVREADALRKQVRG